MKTNTTYSNTKKSITGFFNNIKLNSGLLSLLFVLFFAGSFQSTYAQTVSTYTSSTTWTCPAGVTSVQVECWGGGGAGGSAKCGGGMSDYAYGAGGAGGAYALKIVSVTPGVTYTVTVGASAASDGTTSAVNGNPSWFSTTSTVYAQGGAGGTGIIQSFSSGSQGGTKGTGSSSSSIGDIKYAGGSGQNGYYSSSTRSGGGGGSGGTSAVGNSATTDSGATAVTGGGAGGSGLNNAENVGSNGGAPGGGGGGALSKTTTTLRLGGSGAAGQVKITYCNAPAIISINGSAAVPYVSYPNISAAIVALSNCFIVQPTVLELTANYFTSGSGMALDNSGVGITLTNISGQSATNTITIRPETGVTGKTLSFSNTSAIFSFNGSDNWIIDGRPGGTGSSADLTIENTSNTTTAPAVKFYNDATNNSIRYCTLKSNNGSSLSGVVVFGDGVASGSGNSTNTIEYNIIDGTASAANPATVDYVAENGIYSASITSPSNSSNIVQYNEFKNIFIAQSSHNATRGIYLSTNNTAWTIKGNYFYDGVTRTPGAAHTHTSIEIASGDGYTIESNQIGGNAKTIASAWTVTPSSSSVAFNYHAMKLTLGTINTSYINKNTITNMTFTSQYNSTNYWRGIYVTEGKVEIGKGTGNANTIGSASGTSISLLGAAQTATPVYSAIEVASTSTADISNNNIGGIITQNTSAYSVTFYGIKTSGAAGVFTISSNTIGSTTVASNIILGGTSTAAGVCTFYGISNAATGIATITSNTIQNVRVYGTGASVFYGIYNTAGAATSSLSTNTIATIGNLGSGSAASGTAGITNGIYNTATAAININSNNLNSFTINNGYFIGVNHNAAASTSAHSISSNTIGDTDVDDISITSTLVSTASIGIWVQSTGTAYTMNTNTIQNITNSGATGVTVVKVSGIQIQSTPTITMTSNTIKNIKASSTAAFASEVYGIYGFAGSTLNLNKNKVLNLYNFAGINTANLLGFRFSASSSNTMINNLVKIDNSGSTQGLNIYGIKSVSGTLLNLYHNTVIIAGSENSAANANCNSYCYQSMTLNPTTFNVTNNIFINNRTTTNNVHYAIWLVANPASVKLDNNYLEVENTNKICLVASTDYTITTWNNLSGVGTDVDGSANNVTVEDTGAITCSEATSIGRGLDLSGTVTDDIKGTSRPNGSAGYKGCYEVVRPSTAVLAGTATICNGSSANLTVTITGGTSPYTVVHSSGTVNSYTSASNISVSPTTLTTYTLTSVTDANGCTATSPSGSAVITVDPTSVGGSIAGSATVCTGTNSTGLTLSGHTGTITKWQSSTVSDFLSAVTDIVNATTSQTATNLTATTYYRAVITSGSCAAANSATATVTVTALNTAGTASSTPSLAINTLLTNITHTTTGATGISNSGVSGANGLPAGVSATWSSNTITISGTPTSSGPFSYSIPLTGGCGSVNATGTITVTADCTTNTWTGTTNTAWATTTNWSCGLVPTSSHDVVIPDVTNDPIISIGDASIKSISVSSGGSLTVNSGYTLTVTNLVTVASGGSLVFENTASLLQTSTGANSGNIVYKRTTTTLANNYDFVYWGSPVASQELGPIWMASNWADTFYSFNASGNNWSRAYSNTVMTPGVGYISRSRNGQPGTDYNSVSTTFTTGGTWTAKFYGVPNNGTVTVPIVKAGTAVNNLIGNPYPSAVDLELFYETNNTILNPNFYFWIHSTAINANAYVSSDYATYNAELGAGVGAGSANTSVGTKVTPTRYLAAGQGFFASAATSRGNGSMDATFSNTHRVSNQNNSFYRPAHQARSRNGLIESHKIWLNLSNDKGAFKQQLLAYAQGATLDYDTNLEAVSYDGNANLDFYSNLTDKKLVIQSRPLPFNADDIVPLGYKSAAADTYQIAIDQVDGFFLDGQAIYLEDKLQNVIHDFKQGAYTFATAAGTFNDRFVIRYKDPSLGITPIDFESSVKAIVTDKVTVYAGVEPIQSIEVIDLLGRTIGQYDKINATTYTLGNLFKSDKVLFLKIKLSNQAVVTKKIIF